MKVGGPSGVGSAQPSSGRGAGAAAGGFSVASPDGAQETAASTRLASTLGIGSIDALLALQEVGGPTERRRKAVRQERARTGDTRLEDVLDEIETRAEVEMAKLEQHAAAT